MSSNIKFSACFETFGNQVDRFCTSGYEKDKLKEGMFADAAKVEDLSGLELVGI